MKDKQSNRAKKEILSSTVYSVMPIFCLSFAYVIKNSTIDWVWLIGDGDLCMTSFLIMAPIVFFAHKNSLWINSKHFVFLCLCTGFSLVSGSIIKTNEENYFPIVLVVSIVFFVVSFIYLFLVLRELERQEKT